MQWNRRGGGETKEEATGAPEPVSLKKKFDKTGGKYQFADFLLIPFLGFS